MSDIQSENVRPERKQENTTYTKGKTLMNWNWCRADTDSRITSQGRKKLLKLYSRYSHI